MKHSPCLQGDSYLGVSEYQNSTRETETFIHSKHVSECWSLGAVLGTGETVVRKTQTPLNSRADWRGSLELVQDWVCSRKDQTFYLILEHQHGRPKT